MPFTSNYGGKMSLSQNHILDALDNRYKYAKLNPKVIELYQLQGIVGHHHMIADGYYWNKIFFTRITEKDADDLIKQTCNQFDQWGKSLGWSVNGTAMPKNLEKRLKRYGFVHHSTNIVMAYANLEKALSQNPEVQVWEINRSEWDIWAETMYQGYPLPEKHSFETMEQFSENHTCFYIAFQNGTNEPMGCAMMEYHGGGEPIVVLSGATTLPEHRGKGVFNALVASRLQDAYKKNQKVAVTYAVSDSSAPIFNKLDFEEISQEKFYIKEYSK
jgi:N-acetylglutamate synthase-like GNAT family acetyltransferase